MVAASYSRRKRSSLKDYFITFIIAIVIALLVRHFLLEAYHIPVDVDTMSPAILPGDYIFINKLSFFVTAPFSESRLTSVKMPQRGDIVVYASPLESRKRLVRRVLGLPGDQIRLFADGWHVNEVPNGEAAAGQSRPLQVYQVPSDTMFVLGDNEKLAPNVQQPITFVPLSYLRGKVLFVGFSFDAVAKSVRWQRFAKGVS